jgi:dienelactone hydrolase
MLAQRQRSHILALALVFSATVFAAEPALAAAEPLDPAKAGPYPVGVTTMLLVDHSRTDVATEGGPRSLMTEIWYPATDETRDLSPNRLIDFYADAHPAAVTMMKLAFNSDLLESDKAFQNFAVRDARVRDGLFPLLLFSHGNGGMRSQSVFWCEHLASHGYIVMAPDHTGNCLITFIDGEPIVFSESAEGREIAAKDRPKDLSFLIDSMDRMNKGNDSRFFGRVDLDRIGVAGHSFGGYATTSVADQDPRVKAIAPMAGVAPTRTRYDCPVMVVMATEDDTINLDGNERVRAYYSESNGVRYLVEFKNGGHYSFTEMFQFNATFGDGVGTGQRITNGEPITYVPMDVVFGLTNAYTTAFFGRYLKGLAGYDEYLAENHNPAELITKSVVPEASGLAQ